MHTLLHSMRSTVFIVTRSNLQFGYPNWAIRNPLLPTFLPAVSSGHRINCKIVPYTPKLALKKLDVEY